MRKRSAGSAIVMAHPLAFTCGTLAIAIGVVAHVPDFLASGDMGYRMAGMTMSPLMNAGMFLIVAGLVLTTYGLVPSSPRIPVTTVGRHERLRFRAMDGSAMTGQHWGLFFVLGIALVVDVMKPATLGFVVPGMRDEYGVSTAWAAGLAFASLTGGMFGSLLWGMLADRIGRRASILLASMLFMATSICGFMPSLGWNLFMCLIMGMAAGGMLPIVYALMTESMPAGKRGWLVVLQSGLGASCGYLAASGLAALLEPEYTWRILWFAGLPGGLLLLLLNRWIPESPRFLMERGRVEEAEVVMQRYGVVATAPSDDLEPIDPRNAVLEIGSARSLSVRSLFRWPYLGQTITVGMYGLGWGMVNWGFVTFTPTILREQGIDGGAASRMLFWSALIAVPATFLVAFLYGQWSSRKSMILFATVTAVALLGFAIVDPGADHRISWMMPLMVLLLASSGGIISTLSPYTAEVYPTTLRGTGSGFAAGTTKAAGILAPAIAAFILPLRPGFTLLAVIMSVPVILSAARLFRMGVETRGRSLEELTGETTGPPLSQVDALELANPNPHPP